MPSRLLNMFNLCLCNAATIRYSQLKLGHMHLCGMDYKYFSPHCCKCNSFGCTVAIRCGNACRGPHSDSLYSGSEHSLFNSPRLVKREAGFPNPRRALIGSNQLWRVNDSPYYRELIFITGKPSCQLNLSEGWICRADDPLCRTLILPLEISEKWRGITHHIVNYGDIDNFSGVRYTGCA